MFNMLKVDIKKDLSNVKVGDRLVIVEGVEKFFYKHDIGDYCTVGFIDTNKTIFVNWDNPCNGVGEEHNGEWVGGKEFDCMQKIIYNDTAKFYIRSDGKKTVKLTATFSDGTKIHTKSSCNKKFDTFNEQTGVQMCFSRYYKKLDELKNVKNKSFNVGDFVAIKNWGNCYPYVNFESFNGNISLATRYAYGSSNADNKFSESDKFVVEGFCTPVCGVKRYVVSLARNQKVSEVYVIGENGLVKYSE